MAQFEGWWLLFLGAPFCGKGESGSRALAKLAERGAVTKRYVMGDLLESRRRDGKLVNDSIVNELAEKVLRSTDRKKMLGLDGFGRTMAQCTHLYKLSWEMGCEVLPIFIDTPIWVCRERTTRPRFGADGKLRKDDKSVETRFDVYDKKTLPVIYHLKEHGLISVVGNPPRKDEQESINHVAEEIATFVTIAASNRVGV